LENLGQGGETMPYVVFIGEHPTVLEDGDLTCLGTKEGDKATRFNSEKEAEQAIKQRPAPDLFDSFEILEV